MTFSETEGGSRLELRKLSSATLKSANSGNAVNKDRTTASKGTMPSTVVKVRLEATCVRFFSLVRRRAKRAIFSALDTPDAGVLAGSSRGSSAGPSDSAGRGSRGGLASVRFLLADVVTIRNLFGQSADRAPFRLNVDGADAAQAS